MVVPAFPAVKGETIMHSCEKVLQGIWEYLDRDMAASDVAEIEKHLDLCRSCFSRIEFEQLLRSHMKNKTNHLCPEKLKKRIRDLIDQF